MNKPVSQYTSIGGQAVIEGVMMRSPHFVAVAVRKPNRQIVIQYLPYVGWGQTYSWLRKPFVRGIVTLIESTIQGVNALSYSAQIAAQEEVTSEVLSKWAVAGSMLFAFLLGMGLFVALPHALTVWITTSSWIHWTAQSPWFHLCDGVLKILILLSYVYGISQLGEIRRVFQYHGAEHKSIYAFEAGEGLIVENARNQSTLHPRCGTSFLLFLVLISVAVFSIIFPLLHLTQLTTQPFLNHFLMIFIKMGLMLPVAGLAYELIKLCAFRMDQFFFRMLIWPGLILQKLTTREPSDDQLEVALASLRQVILLEEMRKSGSLGVSGAALPSETEISGLSDLAVIQAQVAEFPEI